MKFKRIAALLAVALFTSVSVSALACDDSSANKMKTPAPPIQ